jgi:hypothetical protein
LACIGILTILSKSRKILNRMYPLVLPLPKNFLQKKHQWALITGASDGIGKEFSI